MNESEALIAQGHDVKTVVEKKIATELLHFGLRKIPFLLPLVEMAHFSTSKNLA